MAWSGAAAGRTGRSWTFSGWRLVGLTWLFAVAAWAFLLWSWGSPVRPSPAVSAACDRAVAAMLDSRDPVELQRADMLMPHLNCRAWERLPREP